MYKHIWIYILLALSVSVCTVSLFMRHEAEQQFHQVEMAVPYYDLVTAKDGDDAALKRLLASGATTIVLRQSMIDELHQRAIVQYYAADKAPPKLSLATRQSNQSILAFEPMKLEEAGLLYIMVEIRV